MSEIKTCNECEHVSKGHYVHRCVTYICMHPFVSNTDIVSGITNGSYCEVEREYNGRCKPEGILHEKRKTLLEIVTGIW